MRGTTMTAGIMLHYAWLERRRVVLNSIIYTNLSELYRLRVHGNPDGYDDPERVADNLNRLIDNSRDKLRNLTGEQRRIENMVQDDYGYDDLTMDEVEQYMLERGEELINEQLHYNYT